MKLNYRDKVVLLVLFGIVVWFIGIWFFIKPAFQSVSDAEKERDNLKTQLSTLKATIEHDKNLNNEIKESYQTAMKNAKPFYDYQTAQQTSELVDKYLDACDIQNLDMTVSEYSSKVLSPFEFETKKIDTYNDKQYSEYQNADSLTTSEIEANLAQAQNPNQNTVQATVPATQDQSVACYTVECKYRGTYDNVKKFCQNLTTNTEKSLVVQSVTVEKEKDEDGKLKDDEISGKIVLNMMMIRKLPEPTDKAAG